MADISIDCVAGGAPWTGPGVDAQATETFVVRAGKTLLTLDTASGDAERLYAALGWTQVGCIPIAP